MSENEVIQTDFFETMTFDEAFDALEAGMLDFEEVPLLLVDTDPERAVVRQKEMMDTVFGGIGEERKAEKRMGLAMQMLDIEQRHALRLLLVYQDPASLISHLKRCLDDSVYGYGERGDQGRTIAQAMAALADDQIDQVATDWFQTHHDFQQRILGGKAFSFRSLFDYADLDSFVPLVQRVGDMTWRLGIEDEGKSRDFHGELSKVWSKLCDAYVEWCEADNETWLSMLKRKAAKLPDTIHRAAWADRLRKERHWLEVEGNQIILRTERAGSGWPRSITLGDQIGLSRLSGHSFYELAWAGGFHVRRFEISGTTRNKIPFEHIEMAMRLAEAVGVEQGLHPEPATSEEIEAAYLRRMKAKAALLGPPQLTELPPAIQGKPVASYIVNNISVAMLHGHPDHFAYIATSTTGETAILLHQNEQRGVMAALPVIRGRVRRGSPLMTTPLADLDTQRAGWRRALCAWGAWLVSMLV